MRILIVTDHYPPYIGGAHRQSYVLGQKLHRLGHQVNVATTWHPGTTQHQIDDGVDVYRFKQVLTSFPWVREKSQRHHPPFPDPVTVFGLRRLIARFKPDLVHSHGWIGYSAAVALMNTRIPLLVSARDYGYSCATRTLLYRDRQCSGPQLMKCIECANNFYGTPKGAVAVLGVLGNRPLLSSRIDALHSISHFMKDFTEDALLHKQAEAKKQGRPVPHPRISELIPSFLVDMDDTVGLDPKYLDQLPKEPYILFVGALMVRKGVKQLLAAYAKLDSPPPLVLIGTVEHDTPRDLPPGAMILKSFPHSCVMVAWERCMFGVTPSLWPEPLGAVVFEAMSRGKAIIGTKPGGHTDMIVDGETGYLVPQGDVEQLAEAMRRLIESPELRERFGKAGKERIKMFTADAILPRFETLYQEVISAHRSKIVDTRALSLVQSGKVQLDGNEDKSQ